MVAIEGETHATTIWCLIDEVAGGDWGVGGWPLTADDVRALAEAAPSSRNLGDL